MNKATTRIVTTLLLGASLAIMGCGEDTETPASVVGTWTGTSSNYNGESELSITFNADKTLSGFNEGSHYTGNYDTSEEGTVTGQVLYEGDTVDFTINFAGDRMTGTFNAYSGESGEFILARK